MTSTEPRRLLHTRAYEIESVLEDDRHFRLIGHLRDANPDGLWGIADAEPLTIHHMQVELLIQVPALTIVDVSVQMHVRPQRECSDILPAYGQLVGLSIMRGFTHKVREMFGGPRACTHIGALLNAMAPVAVQSMWAFAQRTQGSGTSQPGGNAPDRADFERNRNTCHVWAEDGPMFALIAQGAEPPVPLWAEDRLAERGVSVELWRRRPE